MADPSRPDATSPDVPGQRSVPKQRAPEPPVAGPLPAGPPPVTPPPAAPPPARSRVADRRRLPWRRVLLIVVLGTGLAMLGGVGYGFILYDQATKPDRSAPDVVVSNYLRALLVERDDVRAGLYACRDEARLAEIRGLRDDLLSRERQFDITIRVTWGSLAVETDGDRARVTTNLFRTISDGSEQSVQNWRFDVVDQDGWRVCGATKVD